MSWIDKSTKIAAIALITLALSVFFIIYVPAVYHPVYIDGMEADYFPPPFASAAYLVSIIALPVSAAAIIVVFTIKAKQKFQKRRSA